MINTKDLKDKFKVWIGLEKHSPYVKHYFEASNARASIYMSIIIIALETWMIINLSSYFYDAEKARPMMWIVSHLGAYLILFTSGAVALLYADRFIHSEKYHSRMGQATLWSFSAVCIFFGMYISYTDYAKGEQILTFLTMCLFVVCLLVWKPIVSFIILTASFGVFYIMMIHDHPATNATKINYFIMWISLLVTSISIYSQKRTEAIKDESLENALEGLRRKTLIDELTGIPNMGFFRTQAEEILKEPGVDPSKRIFLFLDIENFKAINDKYGFESGSAFLHKFAMHLKAQFEDSLVARQGDDHFVVLTDINGVEEKINHLRSEIFSYNTSAQIGLKAGGYIPKDSECDPSVACDHARYACVSIKKKYDQDYRQYDKDLDEEFKMRQYIVNNIDVALDRGDIKVCYQPVVWSKNFKLCGYEALTKWEDPEYGLISPGIFIPVLEEYRQVHKLDMIVMETVCRDLRYLMDHHKPTVPVSLNFSRLDFELMDAVAIIESCAEKYNVPRKYIHVEITESALSDYFEEVQKDMLRLREYGYPIWLDDFGSGYSSLNVLKDFDFDVIKIDMMFLSSFEKNKDKTKAVIRNIVRMASELGTHTLTEGVETEEEAQFLREVGCERLQGFLFGRSMYLEDALAKINDGSLPVSEEYWRW